jgi:hypothetical protein
LGLDSGDLRLPEDVELLRRVQIARCCSCLEEYQVSYKLYFFRKETSSAPESSGEFKAGFVGNE